MKTRRTVGLAGALLLSVAWVVGCGVNGTSEQAERTSDGPEPVTLTTADGVTAYGDWYGSADARGVLLLFHQAGGDGRGEYGPMLPRLTAAGFDVLLIDQRVGGSRFGGVNRTALGTGGTEYGYCEVYPDLVAALDYATSLETGLPIIAWGSSYSAALVVKLAAEHGDRLAGILAFSPASGEPLADCDPLDYGEHVSIPALFLRPSSEMANERAARQLERLAAQGHDTYVADPGVHGSSMLVAERVEGDVEPAWGAVTEFLEEAISAATTSPAP